MPPKRQGKRALPSDSDDDLDLGSEEPKQPTEPAPKRVLRSKRPDDSDALEVVSEQPKQSIRPAPKGVQQSQKKTLREQKPTTGRRAPAQAPPPGTIPQKAPITRQGSHTSKRALSGQPDRTASTYADVFARSYLTLLNKQKETIKGIRFIQQRPRTGASVVSDESTAPVVDVSAQPIAIPPSTADYLVDQLFAGPPIPGRNWRCEIVEQMTQSKTHYAMYWLVDGTGLNERRWCGQTKLSAPSTSDLAEASRISSDLALAANRFPGRVEEMSQEKPTSRLTMTPLMLMINEAATSRQTHGRRELQAPFLNVTKTNYSIIFKLKLIDPTTHKSWTFQSHVAAVQGPGISTPYFPNIQFTSSTGTGRSVRTPVPFSQHNGRDVHDSAMPDDIPDIAGVPWNSPVTKRVAVLQGEQVARSLVAMLDGLIISKAGLKAQVKQYSTMFGSARAQRAPPSLGRNAGTYGGWSLFRIQRSVGSRVYNISASKSVQRDIDPASGKLPMVTIKSIDRARVVPVCEALTQTWLTTGSLTDAFLACADAAHAANQAIDDGIPAQPVCQRPEDELSCDLTHVCGSCGKTFLCSTMLDGGLCTRVCHPCDDNDRKHWPFGLSFAIALDRMKNVIRKEATENGLKATDKTVLAMLEQAQEELEAWFQGVQNGDFYIDGYSNKSRGIKAEKPSGLFLRDAFAPSIDAAFPYSVTDTGVLRQHVTGNLVVCSLAVNYAKHKSLPAWLSELSIHLSVYDRYQAGEVTQQIWEKHLRQLIEVAKRLSAIRKKANFQMIWQQEHGTSEERLSLDCDEWRSGMFHTFDKSDKPDKPWHKERGRIKDTTHEGAAATWNSTALNRVKKMVAKLEAEFGVRLPRGSIDDCPWFCTKDSMPKSWCWSMCGALMAAVFFRWKELCNKKDPTEDDPECIFIEIIFIACVWIWTGKNKDNDTDTDTEAGKFWDHDQELAFGKEYSEFLGLPIVFAISNPLCLAVGHKLHGHAMRTGWRDAPTELSHRDNERQNMLLESQCSNFAKHNFATADYEGIKTLLRENRQSSLGPTVPDFQKTGVFGKWYDADMPQVTNVKKSLIVDLLEVDEDEGLDFGQEEPMDFEVGENFGREDSGDDEQEEEEEEEGDDEEDDNTGDNSKSRRRRSGREPEQRDVAAEEAIRDEIIRLTKDFMETSDRWANDYSKHFKLPEFQVLLNDMFEAAQLADTDAYEREKDRIEEFINTQPA